MQRRMVFLLAAAAALLPVATMAQPACVAPSGTRFEQVAGLGEWERSRIAALAPDGPARLYLTACGFDCVKGISDPRRAYDATMEVDEGAVTFVLSADGTVRGRLAFAWPDAYTWFGADIRPGDGSGDDLYTELRLSGALTGQGDFAHDGPARAELVLSGFGNMCITARSFSGWSLTVSGPGAEYRLYGGLVRSGR